MTSRFRVAITEVVTTEYEVEADTLEQAEERAAQLHAEGAPCVSLACDERELESSQVPAE